MPPSRRGAEPAASKFAAAAYDSDGRLLNGMLNQDPRSSQPKSQSKDKSKDQPDGQGQSNGQTTGQAPSAAKSDALFRAIQELEVPPGAAWIRLAVRDQLNNRTGTLELRLPLKPETTTTASVSVSASASTPNPGQ